jgi:hypothetical protein
VESVGNDHYGWTPWGTPCYLTGGSYYSSQARAEQGARRRIKHEGAREAVVVDTEGHDDYGVVTYRVLSLPFKGTIELKAATPYPEWRREADVPPRREAAGQ